MKKPCKILLIASIMMLTAIQLTAQKPMDSLSRPLNNFSVNFLGEASVASLNLERLFSLGKIIILAGKVGLGAEVDYCGLIHCEENYSAKLAVTIPHHFTINIGKNKSFFEIGYAGTYLLWDYEPKYIPTALIGFRLQPMKADKFLFRVFIQQPLDESDNGMHFGKILFIPVGVSLGVSF